MRALPELLQLLGDGKVAPVEISEVNVVPLVGAGMLTETIDVPPPPNATYVARARSRQLMVDGDEMNALVAAGAAFDQAVGA